MRSNLFNLVCLRHFLLKRESSRISDMFSPEQLFSLMLAQHVLRYHLIYVPCQCLKLMQKMAFFRTLPAAPIMPHYWYLYQMVTCAQAQMKGKRYFRRRKKMICDCFRSNQLALPNHLTKIAPYVLSLTI